MTSRRSRARLAKPNRAATPPTLSRSNVRAHPYALGAAAGVGAIWLVEEHLGGGEVGPGRRFDFKKLGL